MKRLAFIYNPRAGKGKVKNHFADIIDAFSAEDYEITLVATKGKNHCRDYIADFGRQYDTVVVAGGDGTVNEAFNGLMAIEGKKPVLGYIPTGTTNDFASSCMIPTEIADAAHVAVKGRENVIDAGRFNDKYFCYVAAFGIFTDVAYDTPQQVKNIFGRAAYIVEGIKRITSIKGYRIKAECNGQIIEDEFIFGMVANSNSVGGLRIKSLEVDLSDGLFEVLLFKKIAKATDVNLIVADLLNKKLDSDYYYVFKTGKLSISSEEDIAWTLDGEFGGEHLQMEIENVQNAIRIRTE